MGELDIEAVVLPGSDAELVRYPADEIWLRAVGHGEIQVADYVSTDRDGPPAHSHPWDEVQIVVEGVAEFRVGAGDWIAGGSGTVQLLPKGVAHAIRIPVGEARIIQVSIGAPYDGFARDMARLFAEGASLDRVVEVANTHGVRLAGTYPTVAAGSLRQTSCRRSAARPIRSRREAPCGPTPADRRDRATRTSRPAIAGPPRPRRCPPRSRGR